MFRRNSTVIQQVAVTQQLIAVWQCVRVFRLELLLEIWLGQKMSLVWYAAVWQLIVVRQLLAVQ